MAVAAELVRGRSGGGGGRAVADGSGVRVDHGCQERDGGQELGRSAPSWICAGSKFSARAILCLSTPQLLPKKSNREAQPETTLA